MKRPLAVALCLPVLLGTAACLGDRSGGSDAGAVPQPSATIGIPDTETERLFVELPAGGDIPLETYGQGGYHAVFVIQLVDLGNAAWVDVHIRNLDGTGETGSTPTRQPQLLACDDLQDPHVCSRGPITVLTAALAEPADLEGLHVAVEVIARTREGLMATHATDGYLRMAP